MLRSSNKNVLGMFVKHPERNASSTKQTSASAVPLTKNAIGSVKIGKNSNDIFVREGNYQFIWINFLKIIIIKNWF